MKMIVKILLQSKRNLCYVFVLFMHFVIEIWRNPNYNNYVCVFYRDAGFGSYGESTEGAHRIATEVYHHCNGLPVCLPTPVSHGYACCKQSTHRLLKRGC